MIWIEAVNGKEIDMREPWQLEAVRYMSIEKRNEAILGESPTCEHCGGYVDIYGVKGEKYYYEIDGMYICNDCMPHWLRKETDIAQELALEYADEHLIHMTKDYMGD